jgi:hypothetical protein
MPGGPSPRISVVIPTRNRSRTLAFTLQTCLAQQFDDCEFVVSDNGDSPETRQTVSAFADARLRYVRTPGPLAMTDSWEFAVGQAAGQYVTLLGDDDGLLLHALPEIDRLLRLLDTPALRWESVCYCWPELPAQRYARANELLVPLTQTDHYHPIHRRDARAAIGDAGNSRITYAQLPTIYCAAIRRDLLDRLRARAGRLFRSRYADIYSGFAFAYLAGAYHSATAPMAISALSERSTGVATLYLHGRAAAADEFRRLNAEGGHAAHPRVPDLPVMPAMVADALEYVRDALFPHDRRPVVDRKALVTRCVEACVEDGTPEWSDVARTVRTALGDDPGLLGWFDARYGGRPPTLVRAAGESARLPRYGGTYLNLDAAEFGVRDVVGVAELCERLLGYRADGVNAHPAPGRPKPLGRLWARLNAWSRLRGPVAAPDGQAGGEPAAANPWIPPQRRQP